jgi:signal transduction histidine kinase
MFGLDHPKRQQASGQSATASPGKYSSRPLAGGRTFSLSAWFAVLSAVCILGVTVTSSVFLSRFLVQSLLARDAQATMEVVQSIVEVQNPRASSLDPAANHGDHRLEDFFAHVARLPDVLRANIYARDQRVVWSSDPSLIGRVLGTNPELERSLAGEVTIESGVIGDQGPIKPEHILLHSNEPRFVELYLPVRASSDGSVIGVVEVYKVPKALFEAIAHGLRLVWAFALGGGALLYIALFWMVRRADRLIEQQSERLVETETLAVIGEMTGAIAHGIRNPLASIRTSAELCQGHPSPEVRDACGDIVAQVDRLSGWLRQLLTYADQRPGRVEAVAVTSVLDECLDGFSRDLGRRGVALRTEIDPDLPPVRAERVRLAHVFNSILSNAIEASADGGRLVVRARRADPSTAVRVTVIDEGVGISRDQLARVFAPFFTTKRTGLGLGLPLVKRIVNRFGGSVWIDSAPGRGTEFNVELLTAEK